MTLVVRMSNEMITLRNSMLFIQMVIPRAF
jgi:hypothetical protein